MTARAVHHTDDAVEVAGLGVRYLRGGGGPPAVVLHHSTGSPGWSGFHDALAGGFDVVAPDMPGYGQSARPEWAREPRDLAILLNLWCDRMGLDRIVLVGFGMGGFVAAEMATMHQGRLSHLVLVGAPGIQPTEGEIADQMMVDFHEYVAAGFARPGGFEQVFGDSNGASFKELWDFSREMTARLTWKPYMFNRRLPGLLKGVTTPALVVMGSEDAIVPRSVADQYVAAMPNARLEVIPGAGHLVEYEEPERLLSAIRAFALNG
jgi:pimeloyl-ACP methyl ester carboxylesterase